MLEGELSLTENYINEGQTLPLNGGIIHSYLMEMNAILESKGALRHISVDRL